MKVNMKKEIKDILKNWNLGEIISCKKATKGAVNHNWIIKTSKGNYVLRKLNREYKTKDIEFELGYLTYLKEAEFPYKTPAPILTKTKKKFLKIRKDFLFLYELIEGKHCRKSGKIELSEIALMLARFHDFLEKSRLDNGKLKLKDFGRQGILKEMKGFALNMPEKKDKKDKVFLKESKKLMRILESLDTRFYNSLKKYPIHRDINPENLLWKNKKITGILDFENVGHINDALIRDIAILMQYFCSNNGKTLNVRKARFFIKEYKKHRKLSKQEIKILVDSLIATNIEDFEYAYWLLVNSPERAKIKHLNKYSKISQNLYNNRDKFIMKLTK